MSEPMMGDHPPIEIWNWLRDEMRATSLVYEHLVTTAGLGVAEQWLDALECKHNPGFLFTFIGRSKGWFIASSDESEKIAKASHPLASDAVLTHSLREWEAAKARYEQSLEGGR
jgi:hypothetical protein